MNGVSLVVPFYNEEEVLEATLREIDEFFLKLGTPFELILGDDGSTDSSPAIAEKFRTSRTKYVRFFRNDRNRGRGSILTRGFSIAEMPIVAYIDADLEIGIRFLLTLLRSFEDPKVQVSTGTKLRAPQPLNRAQHRKLASIVFNLLIQLLLRSYVSDHQCGLKGFRRDVIRSILPDIREEGWAWDTEVLLLAQKKGCSIDEFPVELESRRESKVPFIATIFMFSRKMIEFRRRGLAL